MNKNYDYYIYKIYKQNTYQNNNSSVCLDSRLTQNKQDHFQSN